jgi:hypothetical protein
MSLHCQIVTFVFSPVVHDCWSIFSPLMLLQHRHRCLWNVTQCNWKIDISVLEKYATVFFREFIGYSEGRHLFGTERCENIKYNCKLCFCVIRSILFRMRNASDKFVEKIIIIIIISHQSGLNRHVSASSNSLFKMSSKSSSSILSIIQHYFWSSCCYPFLLHVIDNLICIVLLSRQLHILSSPPQYLQSK